MVTLSASTSPLRIAPYQARQQATTGLGRWTRCQTEGMGHIAVLEQATSAVLEGYLGDPLYHRAAHTAQRLLALAETMGWDEGSRVAREMTCLFQTAATFGLVQALHLSELIAAFYREMARASAGQTPTRGRDVTGDGGAAVPPAASGDVVACDMEMMA
jgi:hypothetical protein